MYGCGGGRTLVVSYLIRRLAPVHEFGIHVVQFGWATWRVLMVRKKNIGSHAYMKGTINASIE